MLLGITKINIPHPNHLLFRGTSEGFLGNKGARIISVIPASKHLLLAYLFAKEASRFGKRVLLVFDRTKIPKNIITLANVFETDEQECALDVKPIEAFNLAEKVLTLKQVMEKIKKLNIRVEDYIEKTYSNRYKIKKDIESKRMKQLIKKIYEI
jgi:hypothetical protein